MPQMGGPTEKRTQFGKKKKSLLTIPRKKIRNVCRDSKKKKKGSGQAAKRKFLYRESLFELQRGPNNRTKNDKDEIEKGRGKINAQKL